MPRAITVPTITLLIYWLAAIVLANSSPTNNCLPGSALTNLEDGGHHPKEESGNIAAGKRKWNMNKYVGYGPWECPQFVDDYFQMADIRRRVGVPKLVRERSKRKEDGSAEWWATFELDL